MQEYVELSRANVQEKRNVVISSRGEDGFTIAQQISFEEDKCSTHLFLKGAIHISDVYGLMNLRDALNIAIEKVEKK